MSERGAASERVFEALSKGQTPSNEDLMNCGVDALMAAQEAERVKNPLTAAYLDRINGYRR